MDIIKKGFGNNLKQLRKIKNLTQEKLAEMVGINLRQLARIEAGESFVTSETLLKICTTLDVTPKSLFDYDINEAYLMTGTGDKVHFSVIKSGNIIQLIKDTNQIQDTKSKDISKIQEIDNNMQEMAKRLNKEITVDEIRDGVIIYTKIYKPNGKVEILNKISEHNDFENLKEKIQTIANDEIKLEFMNIAFDSLFNKNSLNELKILIKGIELSQV